MVNNDADNYIYWDKFSWMTKRNIFGYIARTDLYNMGEGK